MKYEAVLFDMDDTLIKTWQSKWAHYRAVGKKYYNIESIPDEKLAKHWGEPFPKLVNNMFGDVDLDEAIQNFLRHETELPKPKHEGATETLKALLDRGVKLGVVTSMITAIAEEDMGREFSLDMFAHIQGADHTPAHKPDPRVFDPALERLAELGVTDKKKIVYVGDALNDFYAARDAGLDFIAITTGRVTESEFKKAGVRHTMYSLEELPSLVVAKEEYDRRNR